MREYARVLLTVLLILLLTVNLLVFQWLIQMQTSILNPSFYDDVFKRQQFYGQLRQFVLKTSKENLRFGNHGISYLEEALTEEFLREELLRLASQLQHFFYDQSSELPIIQIVHIKERVADLLTSVSSDAERDRLVQYWFDPLVDEVRFSYFTTIEPFYRVQTFMAYVDRYRGFIFLPILLILGLFMLISWSVYQGFLWSGVSFMASGGILAGLGLYIAWLLGYSPLVVFVVSLAAEYGFPAHGAEGLLRALGLGFSLRMYGMALAFILIGGLLIHFTPVNENA